jgi:hypothetical protein
VDKIAAAVDSSDPITARAIDRRVLACTFSIRLAHSPPADRAAG